MTSRKRGRRRSISLVAAGAVLCGCGDTGPPPGGAMSSASVRDSAGIRIVENHDSVWTEATRWRLADAPDLVIGSVDGSVPGTDWGRVDEVLEVDGRVVVVDGQVRLLRVFDSEGRWERDLGGRGDGPLEFTFTQDAYAVGDSVVVWDSAPRKLVYLHVGGGGGRALSFPGGREPGTGELVDVVLPDGRFVTGPVPAFGEALPVADRIVVGRVSRVVEEPGAAGDTLGDLPVYLARSEGSEVSAAALLLTPVGDFTATDGRVWFGWSADAYEIRRFDVSAQAPVETRIRRPWAMQEVPRGLRDELLTYYDSTLAAAGLPAGAAARQRQTYEAMAIADPLPAYQRFEVTANGFLWVNDAIGSDGVTVETVRGVEPIGSRAWSVFDPEGRWLGTVRVPDDFVLTWARDAHVLGVRTDDLGVQWVERYAILKPE